MERREYLTAAGVGLLSVAGCISSGESDTEDTDGDGVIDSADYAPGDPDVQAKSDLVNTDEITPTPKSARSPSPTPPPSPTPSPSPSPTPSPTAGSNVLEVDDAYWTDNSHIVAYGPTTVSAYVEPEFPETDYDDARLYVGLYEFPRSSVVSEQLSARFNRSDGPRELDVDVDGVPSAADGPFHYLVGYVPGSRTEGTIDLTGLSLIMESDPFEVGTDGTIRRAKFPEELDDDTGPNYHRNNVEGAYQLNVHGRTYGKNWTVSFFAYKSAHAVAVARSRGRARHEYVSFELTHGTAQELGALLKAKADAFGFSAYEAVEFAIDFVQALPYVPDDVSTGFDDYTKFIMETMPELGGDCEDSSILLASILESEAFYYDAILIQPPGHMAVGIYQHDPQGAYYELDGRTYAYIETTGQGWGIGDIPEAYEGASAYLHQV